MSSNLWSRIGLGLLCLGALCSPLRAADPAPAGAQPIHDPIALAAVIDRYIDEGAAAHKATPAPIADDYEFVRRVYLDLTGRIPRRFDIETFLKNTSPNRRAELVDDLLESPQYVNHMTHVYRTLLLPQNNNPQVQALAPAMEQWLRKQFLANTPYNDMVHDLLTTNVVQNQAMQQQQLLARGAPPAGGITGIAYFQANELKPENLAASSSRLFLGVKLECAQCHDSKFDKWTRKQFWAYAAFFSGIGPQTPPQPGDDADVSQATDAAHNHVIKMPGSDKPIQARFLDGKQPEWKDDVPTREVLADWVVSPSNPYFAPNAANRVWAHLFGIGIVDPPDDFRADNAPSHPELLNVLAQAFVDNKYDLKFLIRAITASKAYQRTSGVEGKADDPRLFTRMSVKGLTAEQLYDSLGIATRFKDDDGNDPNAFVNPFGGGGTRQEFLARFSNSADKRTEATTSILQALALMNGRITGDTTSAILKSEQNNATLAAACDSPWLDVHQKLDWLYLSALGRPMRPAEAERMIKYVEKGGPSGDQNKALADVFWVLLNGSEFIFNH
ncbi:MAG TPA: DUF1549 domain-containing protein [Gemmataceae bacterium]|nr:DUF1549 domain-containing protein [Gemmataceae bacterium]